MPRLLDLQNKRFGHLTVLSVTEERKWGWVVWLCKCACGKLVKVTGPDLKRGHKKSCGCIKGSDFRLVGKRFGKLTVMERKGSSSHGAARAAMWKCLCDCGKIKIVNSSALVRGFTKSCGCLHQYEDSERAAKNALYYKYKRHAKERKLFFDLTFGQFICLTKQNCYYCDRAPSQVTKAGKSLYTYNGIDRSDNTVGYQTSNCVSCCARCNRAKDTMTLTEYVQMIKSSYDTLSSKGFL